MRSIFQVDKRGQAFGSAEDVQLMARKLYIVQIVHWDCSVGRRWSESRVEGTGRGQMVRAFICWPRSLTSGHGEVLKGIQQGGNTFIHSVF